MIVINKDDIEIRVTFKVISRDFNSTYGTIELNHLIEQDIATYPIKLSVERGYTNVDILSSEEEKTYIEFLEHVNEEGGIIEANDCLISFLDIEFIDSLELGDYLVKIYDDNNKLLYEGKLKVVDTDDKQNYSPINKKNNIIKF